CARSAQASSTCSRRTEPACDRRQVGRDYRTGAHRARLTRPAQPMKRETMKNITAAAVLMLVSATSAFGDEGMWTPDNLPKAQVQANHGFTPDAKWAEHVQKAALRLAGGCSGSFVSPDGLVLTNHHCINSCVQQLSSAEKDYIKDGF